MNEWNRYLSDSLPPENERVLVSDGLTQTIAFYVTSENHKNWFFENDSYQTLEIEWWQSLPVLPPKFQKNDLTIAPE
jgi:hypothetical protein